MDNLQKTEIILGLEPEEIIAKCQLFDVMSLTEARDLWESIFDFLRESGDSEKEAVRVARILVDKLERGAPLDALVEATDKIWRAMVGYLLDHFKEETPLIEFVVRFATIVRNMRKELLYTALEQQRETIAKQIEAIKELSLPVVEVWDKVLALPIVGTLDSYRVRTMMEELLNRIVNVRARVVILDITGVGVMDTETANYLLRTAKASRLLGAEVIMTGISPAIAQTLVQLGVDLGTIITRATLKGGLEYAFNMMGLEVRNK